jgi:hypothetical protein
MILTDKKIVVEKRLVRFLVRMARRISQENPKLDYPLLIDGYEGYGKTNIAVGIAYVIAYLTKRSFTLDNIFFDADDMIEYAIKNTHKIIVWDEAALAALAMQNTNDIQIQLVKMLMVARKNRHLFIINIPRFYRLKEPIIERCMGLVHVYARREVQLGRFYFYRKKSFDALYEDYKRTRRKPDYSRYVSVRGTFDKALAKVLDEHEYDMKKDEGILTMLNKSKRKYVDRYKQELWLLKKKLSSIKPPIKTKYELAAKIGVPESTLRMWSELNMDEDMTKKPQETRENASLQEQVIYTKGVELDDEKNAAEELQNE